MLAHVLFQRASVIEGVVALVGKVVVEAVEACCIAVACKCWVLFATVFGGVLGL